MTQPNPTVITAEDLADLYRRAAKAAKRAEYANRESARLAAEAHDQFVAFALANGVRIVIEEDSDGR